MAAADMVAAADITISEIRAFGRVASAFWRKADNIRLVTEVLLSL
jgi:hypothetical protein